jgi:hypothetical protein
LAQSTGIKQGEKMAGIERKVKAKRRQLAQAEKQTAKKRECKAALHR